MHPTHTPLNKPPPLRHKRAKPFTCEIKWIDASGVEQVGKGRQFNIGGKLIDLFSIGTLCAMLERGYPCIYKWEEKYNFPKALYLITDDGQTKRFYSRAQLRAVHELYEKVFHGLRGKENRAKLKEFIQMVNALWFLDGRDAA